jgi:hypothetical protein
LKRSEEARRAAESELAATKEVVARNAQSLADYHSNKELTSNRSQSSIFASMESYSRECEQVLRMCNSD